MFLDGIEWSDGGSRVAFAVEVEGEEAGDVLDQAENLVSAESCGEEFEEMRDSWVVSEGVGDHCDYVYRKRGAGKRVLLSTRSD